MAIDARYRDKNGEISRKHGKTLIGTLRMTYVASSRLLNPSASHVATKAFATA